MRNIKSTAFFLVTLFLLLSTATHAAEKKPAWLQTDVLKSAIAINMTAEQQPKFQGAITVYLTDFQKSFKKILRGSDATGIKRKVKRMNNSLKKKMDSAMAEFLSEEQMQKYAIYRDTLSSAMRL
jgi:hypothetical protein